VWLKPFALFQLKTESKGVTFEELGGVDSVGGEHPRFLRQENTGLATIRGIAAEVRTGGNPCEIGGILEEDGVGRGRAQQFANSRVLLLDVG
jgi:hypothetical protein